MGSDDVTGEGRMRCTECGYWCDQPGEFHPHLFCVLHKAGVTDPAEYLAQAGWTYAPGVQPSGASDA